MDVLSGPYSNLLIPAALGLILLVVILRVVHAVVRLVGLFMLVTILIAGYTLYGRIAAVQKAADAAASLHRPGTLTAGAIAGAVDAPARQALAEAGLDPHLLRVRVVCGGPQTRVELRYDDHGFPYGLLSSQAYSVPLSGNVRCQ